MIIFINLCERFPILIPVTVLLVTEFLKITIDFVKTGKLSLKSFFSTGGIPSGHSAFTSSLIVVVLDRMGIGSVEFAIVLVFGSLVIFDSVKLRAEAGKHAVVLNYLTGAKNLNERLGHTVFEVMTGIFLGVGIAFLLI